jgi:hypothetical protein
MMVSARALIGARPRWAEAPGEELAVRASLDDRRHLLARRDVKARLEGRDLLVNVTTLTKLGSRA